MLPGLLQQLRQELLAEGIDPDKAAQVFQGLQYCLANVCLVDLCKWSYKSLSSVRLELSNCLRCVKNGTRDLHAGHRRQPDETRLSLETLHGMFLTFSLCCSIVNLSCS